MPCLVDKMTLYLQTTKIMLKDYTVIAEGKYQYYFEAKNGLFNKRNASIKLYIITQ